MISTATLRYVRISPRKVRPVIALIKGKKAEDAIAILMSVKKKASTLLIDVISSALANARRVPGTEPANLYISSLIANGGPQLKRFRAASMGRASTIRKRTSHITVQLDSISSKIEQPVTSDTAAHSAKKKIAKVSSKTDAKAAHSVKKSSVRGSTKTDHGKKGKE